MDEDGFFIEQRICIVGLGLMGGSLALALRGYCTRLIGVDPDPETLALAREKTVVDFATDDLAEALAQTDLVIPDGRGQDHQVSLGQGLCEIIGSEIDHSFLTC